MYRSYEDLDVWRRSCELAITVIRLFHDCKNFPIKDQVTKSAFSVPSNIAEGAERDSRLEFIRFLNIAKGISAAELRTQLYICQTDQYSSRSKIQSTLFRTERNFCHASRPDQILS
ncbi:MAG: four helix bundle protein [candidate division KSB1 bacterium]|nr:four helix bundle protein [candidate division KSB1 bacterium]